MKPRASTALFVAGSTLLMVLALGILALATAPRQAASGASISASCPKDEPVQKCLYKVPANSKPVTGPPITSPPDVPPLPPSPNIVNCGQYFLSGSELALLQKQFGLVGCFQFMGQRTWVLWGNGESQVAPPVVPSPGGVVVALDTCAAGDQTCMNANAPHPLSAWTLYYPPGPISMGSVNLQRTIGGRLLFMTGMCGVFDIVEHVWIADKSNANLDAYLQGSKVATLPAPAPVPATYALSQPTPPRTNSC